MNVSFTKSFTAGRLLQSSRLPMPWYLTLLIPSDQYAVCWASFLLVSKCSSWVTSSSCVSSSQGFRRLAKCLNLFHPASWSVRNVCSCTQMVWRDGAQSRPSGSVSVSSRILFKIVVALVCRLFGSYLTYCQRFLGICMHDARFHSAWRYLLSKDSGLRCATLCSDRVDPSSLAFVQSPRGFNGFEVICGTSFDLALSYLAFRRSKEVD